VPHNDAANRDANDDFVQFGPEAVRAAVASARAPRRKPEEPSEDDVAMAFTKAHGDTLRYDHDVGQWFEWTGMRWQKDGCHRAFTYARTMARKIGGAGKASFAGGVEKFARADPVHAVTSEIWDSDPLLLGTPGGTVDLRDGEYAASRPGDHITKLTGVAPEHGAPTRWLQFLDEATAGDRDLMRFLQQMAGYCLTGLTDEHALFFIYGPGGNGKSVFLNMLSHVLGDYATTASMDTFTASKSDRHPTDLAMLKGARLVSASETEEGRAWAEARIKQLTGGDRISARFMRQDFFEFTPAFKLVIVGNHAPVLANVDDAARRRFNIVPFTQKPARPDPMLEQKLKEEAPQILAWAIAGCLDWQRNRLVRPEIVTAATQDYFDDQDLFGQWLKDRCDCGVNKWEMPTPLYNDWAEYARAAGDDPGTQRAMSSKLRKAGFRDRKSNGLRSYAGIALRKKDTGHD
jgi:putative DNA primase/helicase